MSRPGANRSRTKRRLTAAALMLLLLPFGAQAGQPAQKRSLAALPLPEAQSIVVDGDLTEDAWRDAEVATGFIQQEPRSGQPATERTEVRVAYDESHLYVLVQSH